MNEYRVRVTVRNNLILKAIEEAGYTNLAKFAKDNGISLHNLYHLINLRLPPMMVNGEFSDLAKLLMETLGACPSDLWSNEQLSLKLDKNKSEQAMSLNNMIAVMGNPNAEIRGFLPQSMDESLDKAELSKIMADCLDSIHPRQAKVLRLRYGIGCDEHTLEQVAAIFECSKERIRQIEAKAMRMIRLPSKSERVKDYLEE